MAISAKNVRGEGDVYNEKKRLANVRYCFRVETDTETGSVSVTGQVITPPGVPDFADEGELTLHMNDGQFLDFYVT